MSHLLHVGRLPYLRICILRLKHDCTPSAAEMRALALACTRLGPSAVLEKPFLGKSERRGMEKAALSKPAPFRAPRRHVMAAPATGQYILSYLNVCLYILHRLLDRI